MSSCADDWLSVRAWVGTVWWLKARQQVHMRLGVYGSMSLSLSLSLWF